MLKTLLMWLLPPFFPGNENKTRSALLLNVILNTLLIALPILILAVIKAHAFRYGPVTQLGADSFGYVVKPFTVR